ncbi:hypothetical protein [Herbaspirillum sp. YR522]|uniref:hypothetical protein n=1 Tax=Herbaspirillum sp. YR522 TaxID=1144342 RepID=UPI00026FCD7D|nr:hypothetical protein [Herbaspirillum sp. YR522]EJN02021.1 hypothetical protein PMI40_03144 [Herbaspirillum sp. YR522]
MHHLLLAAAVSLFLTSSASEDVIDADLVAQLAMTPTFAIGQVGLVGHISHGEQVYRRILRSPSGFRIFAELLRGRVATTEARLYAACGIRHLAPAAFDGMTRELRAAGSSASVLYTDILRRESIGERGGLLDRIKKNGCNASYHLHH